MFKVYIITTHQKNGDVWRTKRGTQDEVDEVFRNCWACQDTVKITVEERFEELKLTRNEDDE